MIDEAERKEGKANGWWWGGLSAAEEPYRRYLMAARVCADQDEGGAHDHPQTLS